MSPDYLGAWVVGLLGAGHCLGMCGGISALLTLDPSKSSPALLLYYNLGRLLSYALIGGIVGGITASLTELIDVQSALVWLRIFAAVLMIVLGLYIGRWWFGLLWLEKVGQKIWRWISPLGKTLLPLKTVACTTLRPCVGLASLWFSLLYVDLVCRGRQFLTRGTYYVVIWVWHPTRHASQWLGSQ